MVATDRYRLASRQEILETPSGESVEVIVPSRALDEVTRMVGDEGSITIGVSENQVSFEFGRTLYISRRIEGTFPNYSALLPKDFETTVTVERSELIDAVKRVGLLAQHNAPIRCRVSDSTLTLSAKTQDVGEATEDLMVSTEGEMGVEIALNPGFLADALSAPSTERISIGMNGSVKPAVVTPIGGEDFLYLIMPVRLG
jgi:DNA polymerase-3 subunit beta